MDRGDGSMGFEPCLAPILVLPEGSNLSAFQWSWFTVMELNVPGGMPLGFASYLARDGLGGVGVEVLGFARQLAHP